MINTKLIEEIRQIKARNAFKNYIEYIQFPFFRNLEANTEIIFNFPLTVFVGQNGSGKSSTLHALFGAPKKNTPFDFWFSTAVDPIQEVSEGGERHSFFYVYKDKDGNPLEVLKQRIFKRNNPDYWETSRPVLKYGMKKLPDGIRNEPIEKNVVFIDFRSELSAFDKYFYFKEPRRTTTIKNKQDFLRKHSTYLKKIIDGNDIIIKRYNDVKNDPLKIFSTDELHNISIILGKKYIQGKIVRHKLFEEWGYSVIFQTSSYTYSEAFAGSGEMAVVRLVLEVLGAAQYSLLLLDEPEVSLHPGAQKRLKHFLLEQIRSKQLQVVISSHSPSIIEDLPSNAIKVFSQLPSGKFTVKNEITPEEAFYHLEQTNAARKKIIVEDILSKEIITSVLKEIGPDTESLFQVSFYSGGASVLKTNFIKVYSHENELNKFIVFDGDQKLGQQHFDPDSIIILEQTSERFRQEIQAQTNVDVQFNPDGNQDVGARADQEKELRRKYLKFYLRNVFYLPLSTPEEIIWDQSLAEQFLRALNKLQFVAILNNTNNFKEKFLSLTEGMTGDRKNIESIEKMFLNKWIETKGEIYNQTVQIIEEIKTR